MAEDLASPPRPFHPFEYMAWAKAVPAGARFPLHGSGMPAPHPDTCIPFPTLTLAEWTGPVAPLREAFVERLTQLLQAPGRAAVLTAGASEALFLALGPLVQPGAPVLLEEPAYRAMERVVQFLGGRPVHLQRAEAQGWQLDPQQLDALLARTGARLVGLTDPHNPTGVAAAPATRRAVVEVIERRGALLVVDEIFAAFREGGQAPAWAALSERVLSVGSLTKGWGLGALRLGWVLGAPPLVRRCEQLFDLLGVIPPTGTVRLGLAALEAAALLDARAAAAAARARAVFAATDWHPAALVVPNAGLIAFLRLPSGWRAEQAATVLRAQDGVQVVPGHFFGSDRHLRIGLPPLDFDPSEGCRLVAERLRQPPGGAA